MELLKKYGLTERFIAEAEGYENLSLARVIAQYKGLYKIITEQGEQLAQVSGALRHQTTDIAMYPAVGDFVMISNQVINEMAIIHNILTRKSVFLRKAVGIKGQAQVIASNIDIVFICMSLNNNFNLNRLERYLSIAWDSGAKPVVILTKADLCENLIEIVKKVEMVSLYSDIITTSIYEDNRNKLKPYLGQGMTTAFIGSSGVGKSTLINQLLGGALLETKDIGKGDKGKHTTTGRELFPTIYGGVVIDTPGMRELGVENADLSKTFEDIEELVKKCRFNDCTHKNEPGCAVQKAIAEELIDQRRFESYLKLKNEASYEGLNSKQIEKQKLERMFKEVGGMKNVRKFAKKKEDDSKGYK